MIWIVGGTHEGDYLSKKLKDIPHIVTLGTREGLNYFKGENYIYKRLGGYEGMKEFINENEINLVIDVTHPFAVNVSKNAKAAAEAMDIPYYRYERNLSQKGEHTIEFSSYEECFQYLESWKGTLFVTTGSNRVEDFERVRGDNRFIYRGLPMVDSVTKLNNLGIHIKDIVAMVGPFNKDIDMEFIKFFDADAVVMKDSGKVGGTEEKIKAAEEMGITSFLIKREKEGNEDFDDFVKEIFTILKGSIK